MSNDRTDYHTLIPVMKKHKNAFGDTLEAVTADSGYCSEKNLLYLKENGIRSYIKLQDHEKRKTRAYKEDIGRYYNMTYAVFEDEHYYICHDGREVRHIRTESNEQDGYTQTLEVYGCADFLPKGTVFTDLTQWDIQKCVDHINNAPRKALNGSTPYLEAHKLYDLEIMNALQLRYITPDEVVLTPKLLKR